MSSLLRSWFLLSASSLSLFSPLLWLFVKSGTIVTLSYIVFLSSLDLSRMCLLSSSEYSPMTMGLGSCALSPTLLQNLICCFLVLTRIPPNILSISPLSISILSRGFVAPVSGSGTPCITRFSLLDSLSLSSSSIIFSIWSAFCFVGLLSHFLPRVLQQASDLLYVPAVVIHSRFGHILPPAGLLHVGIKLVIEA